MTAIKKRPYRPILFFADEWAEAQITYGTFKVTKLSSGGI